jgi:hypothetical protein
MYRKMEEAIHRNSACGQPAFAEYRTESMYVEEIQVHHSKEYKILV